VKSRGAVDSRRAQICVFIGLGLLLAGCSPEGQSVPFMRVMTSRSFASLNPDRPVKVLGVAPGGQSATVAYFAERRCGTVTQPKRVTAAYSEHTVHLVLYFQGGGGATCNDAIGGAVRIELPTPPGVRDVTAMTVQ
jgi:hypothetical protein